MAPLFENLHVKLDYKSYWT